MLKRKFKLTRVGCLDDITSVVKTYAVMNHPQLVGDQQGNIIVPSYDWIEFFNDITTKNALQECHSRFSLDLPGYVHVKDSSDIAVECSINTP